MVRIFRWLKVSSSKQNFIIFHWRNVINRCTFLIFLFFFKISNANSFLLAVLEFPGFILYLLLYLLLYQIHPFSALYPYLRTSDHYRHEVHYCRYWWHIFARKFKQYWKIKSISRNWRFSVLKSCTKYLEQSKEIQENWAIIKKFDIYFCVFFDCITKVLFLKGRLDTGLSLHPNLGFF